MDADDASFAEMNRPSTDPLALEADAVERLLAGDLPRALAPPGYAEVAALLAATVAPASPEELTGQAAAVAELRAVTRSRSGAAAPVGSAATARRPGKRRGRRRVRLAVALVVGALSTAGAAAAATGQLPGPIREAARDILTTVGVTTPATPTELGRQPVPSPGNTLAGDPAADGQDGPAAGASDPRSDPTTPTSAAGAGTDGLCQAFLAGQGGQQGKKLDAAAFRALADAAGGTDKIATYCQERHLGNPKSNDNKQKAPPSTSGNQGQGQGGPPPDTGGGNQEHGGPPGTRPHER